MSYFSFDELSQNQHTISLHYAVQQPLTENPVVANRSVRFRDTNDTVTFFKESPPNEIELPQHKFQIPCDTITSTDACYQKTQMISMYR
jgi:hypothetical protein